MIFGGGVGRGGGGNEWQVASKNLLPGKPEENM